ncbi:unnamed protein product, partial [Vitis vinifera]
MFIFTSLQFSMRKALQRTILALICTVTLVSAIKNDSCGTGKSAKRVHYPFGFSSDSPIKLNCSKEGEIEIQNFKVQNVTTDSIIINLPAQCQREIQKIEPLFGKNYALSSKNSLLFQNCSSSSSGCVIPTSVFNGQNKLNNCNGKSDNNISCFPLDSESEFMSFANVTGTGCKFLLLSMAVEWRNNSAVSLELGTAQLGWWLDHPCHCAPNAKHTNLTVPGGFGCRCSCKEGFDGDGFKDGDGCQEVTDCNASKYMSGTCGGTTRVAVLVGGVIVGASLMSTVALICYCIRRRSYLRRRMSAKRLICEAAGNSSVPLYPYKEVERATNGFSEKQRLGTGAYGTVFAGKLHNDEWVAIKKIRNRDNDSIEQVMNEIKLISSVNHPNLVRLLGCCIENGEQILVYEFMANGTLSQHLQKERGKVVDFSRPHSEVNLAALAIDRIGRGCVDEIIDPFLEPQRDAWTLCSIHKVAELAFRCLAFHRDMRPSMMEVADELEHVRLSGWAPMEENICVASSVASSWSRRLFVPHRPTDCLASMEEIKDSSPVSVHDPWLSEQSSPSTNSLLGNVPINIGQNKKEPPICNITIVLNFHIKFLSECQYQFNLHLPVFIFIYNSAIQFCVSFSFSRE